MTEREDDGASSLSFEGVVLGGGRVERRASRERAASEGGGASQHASPPKAQSPAPSGGSGGGSGSGGGGGGNGGNGGGVRGGKRTGTPKRKKFDRRLDSVEITPPASTDMLATSRDDLTRVLESPLSTSRTPQPPRFSPQKLRSAQRSSTLGTRCWDCCCKWVAAISRGCRRARTTHFSVHRPGLAPDTATTSARYAGTVLPRSPLFPECELGHPSASALTSSTRQTIGATGMLDQRDSARARGGGGGSGGVRARACR